MASEEEFKAKPVGCGGQHQLLPVPLSASSPTTRKKLSFEASGQELHDAVKIDDSSISRQHQENYDILIKEHENICLVELSKKSKNKKAKRKLSSYLN